MWMKVNGYELGNTDRNWGIRLGVKQYRCELGNIVMNWGLCEWIREYGWELVNR